MSENLEKEYKEQLSKFNFEIDAHFSSKNPEKNNVQTTGDAESCLVGMIGMFISEFIVNNILGLHVITRSESLCLQYIEHAQEQTNKAFEALRRELPRVLKDIEEIERKTNDRNQNHD